MIFYKTSSFGNDFIEIDLRELTRPQGRHPLGGLAAAICDRQRGVGADGVVFYGPNRQAARAVRPPSPRGTGVPLANRIENEKFYFEIFNRDGGGAELSGNGMAGLAAVLFQRRLASSPLTLHGVVGSRRIDLLGRQGPVFQLNVEIGKPDFADRGFFPFLSEKQESYRCAGVEFHPVAVGNPHAVVLCRERLVPARLAALGKKLEGHPMFPRRVNVEFVRFASAENPPKGTAALPPASCRVFFYERGVGPTLASSTGSAAVFAVLRRLGKVRDRLDITCEAASVAVEAALAAGIPAGDDGAESIQVSWNRGIYIHNFTRLVCRGEYFL